MKGIATRTCTSLFLIFTLAACGGGGGGPLPLPSSATRSMMKEADGVVTVELPGPWAAPTRGL